MRNWLVSIQRVLFATMVAFLGGMLLGGGTVVAAPESTVIQLKSRTIHPIADGGRWLDQVREDRYTLAVLQFNHHLTSSEKSQLTSLDVSLQGYTSGGAWVAEIAEHVTSKSLQPFGLIWADEYTANDKISEHLRKGSVPSWSRGPEGTIFYAVRFVAGLSEQDGEAVLAECGLETGDYVEAFNTFYASGTDQSLSVLANRSEILWLDAIAPPLTAQNEGIREALMVDSLYSYPYHLTGEGVTACVFDAGLVDGSHPDFGGRVTIGEEGTYDEHSTHVAGTLGANGSVRGVAPGARLVSYFYNECDPYCLYQSPQDIWNDYQSAIIIHGCDLVNNSIGANITVNGYECEWLGDYELTSALLDSIVRGAFSEPVPVVFSAGNERSNGACGNGYRTLSVPGGAKNVITVGATDDEGDGTSFSSWGPTDDGRIKPELVAPGYQIQSTGLNGRYTTMDGTSMSTPAVSGVVALMLEAWNRFVGGDAPDPSTIKAILCNTARDLGLPGPDYVYGFGMVNAAKAISSVEQRMFREDAVNDGDMVRFSVQVPDGLDELRATLAWSDPPADPFAERTLVNDLKLRLIAPTSVAYNAFYLDPENPQLAASAGINSVDVVEQVLVREPLAGEWFVEVTGEDVPRGLQRFGVAASQPMVELTEVTGVVRTQLGDQPIEGAKVELVEENIAAFSGSNGRYKFYWPGDLTNQRMLCSADHFQSQQAFLWGDAATGQLVEKDFALYSMSMGHLVGHVYDSDGEPLGGARISVEGTERNTISYGDGSYSLYIPANLRAVIRVTYLGLFDRGEFILPAGIATPHDFILRDETVFPTGPDGGGYIAVQSGDNHPRAPVFDWFEIDPDQGGPGIRIPVTGEETPILVNVPMSFRFYGEYFGAITINENGFFALGDITDMPDMDAATYRNEHLPELGGPRSIVAPFWEDFRASMANLSYYFDRTQNRLIVEWYNCRQFPTDGTFETFQVILVPDPDNGMMITDGEIIFQYLDVEDFSNASVGIESPDELNGLEICHFNGSGNGGYAPTAVEITDESAILLYHPVGEVEGIVTLFPEVEETTITVSNHAGETRVLADGSYSMTSLTPGWYDMAFHAQGYEERHVQFQLSEYQSMTDVNVSLLRMRKPVNLQIVQNEPLVGLQWDAPEIAEGGEELFSNAYRVYVNGDAVDEVEGETEWLAELEDDYREFWVTALYANGSESDTSNHVHVEVGVEMESEMLPRSFRVSSAYPNPFNPATRVEIALPEASSLNVRVYDILGREVATILRDKRAFAGRFSIVWDGSKHASGVYFMEINAGKHRVVRKLVLLK